MPLEAIYQRNKEHRTHRSGWLRAAVLGANDGLVSTASLMIGVAAAQASTKTIMITGIAGITAGAMSMAVGEFISVSSQNDIEQADREIEAAHLAIDPEGEMVELTEIYQARGLSPELARQVAEAMHAHDPLEAHLRDELGQHEHTKARPWQAAFASAASFTIGGFVPFAGVFAPSISTQSASIVAFTIAGLLFTGIFSARTAGSRVTGPTIRVLIGGTLGMAITAGIGSLFHLSGI